jgi:hypothetical protein
MQFKDDVKVRVSGTTEAGAELKTLPKAMVCTVRVRSNVRTGTIFTELVVWGDADHDNAQVVANALRAAQRRVVAVGFPTDDVYNGRIQRKVKVEDLWVESEDEQGFEQVLQGSGVAEGDVREFKPIEMPENVRF